MGQFFVGFLQSNMSEFFVKIWAILHVTRKSDISGQIGEPARARYISYVRFGIWDISHTPYRRVALTSFFSCLRDWITRLRKASA